MKIIAQQENLKRALAGVYLRLHGESALLAAADGWSNTNAR